jgi:serine/threonine-protein kinase
MTASFTTRHQLALDLDFLTPSENPSHLGRLGPYEVVDVVGEGGMGIVLKAFDPSLSRVVAIKVLAPQMAASGAARRRFFREAKAAAAVVHDHVVAIHAVDTDPRTSLPYLVMPYIAGRSLQDRLDHDGPLRVEEVLRIGRQAALGLAAAHGQGLVHRDIKPSNILLENGLERVKITDFGLARAVDDASQSQSGLLAGTPQYMSPEQARGDAVDHRSDLFCLGSVLYAMCAGHSPFRARTTMGVLRRVCDEEPRPLSEINPEVPEDLETVINRLHAKEPAQRYATASEVADVLGAQLSQLQGPNGRAARRAPDPGIRSREKARSANVGKTTDGPERIARRAPARTLAATALLALLGLAAAGTAAWLSAPDDPPPAPARFTTGTASSSRNREGNGPQPAPATIIITTKEERPSIVGSGKPATRQWNLEGYSAVAISHAFRADVRRSDRFSVSVTADDNVLEHVLVELHGQNLSVRLQDGLTYRLKPDSLKADITLPHLEEMDVAGSARVEIQGFDSDRPFRSRASGASRLNGSIRAGDVDLAASGASTMALRGRARDGRLAASGASTMELDGLELKGEKLTAEAHGASSVRARGSARAAVLQVRGASRIVLPDMQLESADVVLDGASSATLRVTGLLNFDVGAASRLVYHGDPKIGKAKKTGASSVSHR